MIFEALLGKRILADLLPFQQWVAESKTEEK